MRLSRRAHLDDLLPRYERMSITYPEAGATRFELPAGYGHTCRRTRLGEGTAIFRRASEALLAWELHRGSGLAVAARGPAQANQTVVLGLGTPLSLVIPCRVIYVVDEPSRRGFAYGTLPDHPEQGEESFLVTMDDAGTAWFEIVAFSRPGVSALRYVATIGKAIQTAATRRYETALMRIVANN
jgi:uncharacterized protein (UPF0548 family)